MNVLFISNDPVLFDPDSAARERMRGYANQIGTLHILARGPRSAEAYIKEQAGKGTLVLHKSDVPKWCVLFALPSRARRLIRTEGIELVSAQDPFEYGWIALQAIQGTNAKLHVQIHVDFLSPWFTRGWSKIALLNRVRRVLADRVLPQARGIRVVSERIARSLKNRYGERVIVPSVIPVPVSAVLPAAAPLPPHDFSFAIIAPVGRLESEKRVEDMIHALALVRRTHPEAGLFIAGDGRARAALERLARARGLGKHVVFLGFRRDVLALIQSADACIHASAYEGYSRTLIEAALAHLPIVTTDVGIVGDVLVPDRDVLVAPVARPDLLATQLAKLIEEPELRKKLGSEASHTVRNHLAAAYFSADEIIQDLENARS